MSYKERYKKQKKRNKSLIDRIDDLKLQLSSYNTTKTESMERVQSLIDELEYIKNEYISIMQDLKRCRENYIMLRKVIVQNKKFMIFGLKITDLYLDIKDKFRFKKYK